MMRLMLCCLLASTFGQRFSSADHCMDLSSDCSKRQTLCQNALFEDLMREQCKKTCNFCDDESDGTSIDAPDEEPFIEEQSVEETTPGSFEETDSAVEEPDSGPEPEIMEITTRNPTFSKRIDTCVDRSHDCATKRHLCFRPEYRSLMIKSCYKTCGFCGTIGSSVQKARKISTAYPHINKPYSEILCHDISADCSSRLHLCQNRKYVPLMQKVCRRTCNFC